MSTGCKGYIYKGWQVRYGFDAAKGCPAYVVIPVSTGTELPQVRGSFARPQEAQAFIDKQEGKR